MAAVEIGLGSGSLRSGTVVAGTLAAPVAAVGVAGTAGLNAGVVDAASFERGSPPSMACTLSATVE